MEQLTPENVRNLAARVNVALDDAEVEAVTPLVSLLLGAIERCDELSLAEHEPATTFKLVTGDAHGDA